MKILFISDLWLPFPGGAERYVANLANVLAERGHQIYVLTSYAKAVLNVSSRVDDHFMTVRSINCWEDIDTTILEWSPDLLISHHYFAGQYPQIFKRSIPSLEIIHNRQRNPNASLAVFNSKFTADRCGFQEGDMVILPPAGNDVLASFPPAFAPHCREYIGHIKPLPNKFWKGRWYGKGIQLTYQLAKIMPERRFLVLRGEWQDAEYIERLPNVEFMDPVDDIREFYARCRILLMPSASEDAGTVPQEAAINGIPCISSNVGGLPETNGGGIRLCPHDALPWIKEIIKLDSPEYYDEIARRQRLYIASLDWPKQFDLLNEKLRAICAKSV